MEANRKERRERFIKSLRESGEVVEKKAEAEIKSEKRQVSVSTQVDALNLVKPPSRGFAMVHAAKRSGDAERQSTDLASAPKVQKVIQATTKKTVKELDPKHLKRIEHVATFGSGTYGTCFLAKYRKIAVVVKEYKNLNGKKSLDELGLAARREARIIFDLPDHPGLPFVFGVCTKSTPVQLVLQYHGEENGRNITIYRAARSTPGLCDNTWREIMWRVCDAVEHIHRNGMIHNDIKASNIVLEKVECDQEEKYNPVVIHFGKSVRAATASARMVKPACQTSSTVDSYIAPEVKKGSSPPSFSSDVFSLGKMFQFVSKYATNFKSGFP